MNEIDLETLATVINLARGWYCATTDLTAETVGYPSVRVRHNECDDTVASHWYVYNDQWVADLTELGQVVEKIPTSTHARAPIAALAADIIEAVECASWHEAWGRSIRLVIRLRLNADDTHGVVVEGLPFGASYHVDDGEGVRSDAGAQEVLDDDAPHRLPGHMLGAVALRAGWS